jgi:glycosyltransferase involved in cell wall biosynthesis
MTNPKISVVMAVFNGEKYLKPTIETVLSQRFKDFDFIIVNDGSEDETQNIIEKYHDDRIILINNTRNMGQTASLNIGLQNARGTYIARTDAGDISTPERLRKQFQYLENHSDVDILGTAAFQYDMTGNLCGNVFMPNRPSTILQRIFFACPVVHVSVMMRRDRILDLGGYDESYRILADYGLWARALQQGFRFWNLDEILVGYLVTPDSFGSSHGRGRSIQEASRIICDLALALTGDHLSFDQAEDIYRFFVFGPQDLDRKRIQKTETLFEELLSKLHIPQRDIDYLLLRSYIKMLTGRWSNVSSQKHMLKDALRGISSKCLGGLSFHLFEDLYSGIRSIRCRNSSAIGVKVPAFVHNVADEVKK